MARAVAMVAVALAILSCAGGSTVTEPPEPTATPILILGQSADTPCERAILALHEYPTIDDTWGTLELEAFDGCTLSEFQAFNHKVTESYRYPADDGRGFVDHECRSASLSGTRLCKSRG